MFERFTDKSRRVMVLANEEVNALGQDVIGTEMLLLALSQVEGVASTTLATFNVTPDFIRAAIVKNNPIDKNTRRSVPFTANAKKSLEFALREALALGHSYIGTEHLLLGVLRNDSGGATTLLKSIGLDLVELRATVLSQAGPPSHHQTTPLFEVVKSAGKRFCPGLNEDELNAKAKDIVKKIETEIEGHWTSSTQ
jgi:ATP-dependent Clp protease ATP-binding subunit ClpC